VVRATRTKTAAIVASVRGRARGVAPSNDQWRRGDTAVVNAFPINENDSGNVAAVRDAAKPLPGDVLVGGAVPGSADFNEAVYGNFIWVILVIAVITYILLARVFRSLLLPLKAIVFNIISIGAVWGFMVIFWQEGHGSGALFNIEPTGTADRVDPADGVRVPLRPLDGLRGLHPQRRCARSTTRRVHRPRRGGRARRTGAPCDRRDR